MSAETWAVGMRVQARDEEWVLKEVERTARDGWRLSAEGVSPLVREQPGVFFTKLEPVVPLRPEDTRLVRDDSPQFRRARLFWEAIVRATPLPSGGASPSLATVGTHLIDDLGYQQEPARLALAGLRPRILIADAVGLGKTLEIGLLLSELIRQGRGERILVVTPRHILEQFQHELWCRFALPLVRLDSLGIARVRRTIPAGRNPFTHYKRAIISIDTLKSPQYRAALDAMQWDAVVIDESHKLVNATSRNNELAARLAPRTHALILASATPNSGKRASFGELMALLDPTAVPDPDNYSPDQLKGLFIRRHKMSPAVDAAIGARWAPRQAPLFLRAQASVTEEAVFAEIYTTWLFPPDGTDRPCGKDRLFPFTLFKAFLSSHEALKESLVERMGRLKDTDPVQLAALQRLQGLVDQIGTGESAKFQRLVAELRELEVGPGSGARVVVFSERRATLRFLHENLPKELGFAPSSGKTDGAVRQMHGGLSDIEQQKNVKDFGIVDSDLRILLTGDIAAEGVNLHRQCHELVHYDLPWSLITLEQRNGRIDRYGQEFPPQARVLLHTRPEAPAGQDGDIHIAVKLVGREDEVYRTFGDAAAVMGLYDEFAEEARLRDVFLENRALYPTDADQVLEVEDPFAGMLAALDGADDEPQAAAEAAELAAVLPRLFSSTREFADRAVEEIFDGRADQVLGWRYGELAGETDLLKLRPGPDLQRRLKALPVEYLRDHEVLTEMKATFNRDLAERSLERARARGAAAASEAAELEEASEAGESSGRARRRRKSARELADSSGWPDVTYLSDQHPVIGWLVDKCLAKLVKNTAPLVSAAVAEPTLLVQGMYTNAKGCPTVLRYLAVCGLESDAPRFVDVQPLLEMIGANGRAEVDPESYQHLVPLGVAAARGELARVRDREEDALLEPLHEYESRMAGWRAARENRAGQLALPGLQAAAIEATEREAASLERIVRELATDGDPMIRVLGLLIPEAVS